MLKNGLEGIKVKFVEIYLQKKLKSLKIMRIY